MSGQIPPTGQPRQAGQPGGGPSEEELRQYVTQMRGAPVEQLLAEVLSAVLNGAQVKLGRKDARLLIDLAGTITEKVRPHLSSEVHQQVDDALSQLRMAQVQAENELQQAAAQGEDVAEPNDLDQPPPKPAPEQSEAAAKQPPQQDTSEGSASSRLWTPGQ